PAFVMGGMRPIPHAFSSDGQKFAFQTGESKVSVWNLEASAPPLEIELPGTCRGGLAFGPDQSVLATVCGKTESNKDTILLWDLSHNVETTHFEIARSLPFSVFPAFDPEGKRIAVAAGQSAGIYDLRTGQRELEFVTTDNPLGLIGFRWQADGRHLI